MSYEIKSEYYETKSEYYVLLCDTEIDVRLSFASFWFFLLLIHLNLDYM